MYLEQLEGQRIDLAAVRERVVRVSNANLCVSLAVHRTRFTCCCVFCSAERAQQKNTLAQLLRNFVPGCRLARKSFPQFLNYLPVVSGAAGDGTVKRRTTRNRQKMD